MDLMNLACIHFDPKSMHTNKKQWNLKAVHKQILTYMFHLHIKPTRFNDFVYFGALSIHQFNKEIDKRHFDNLVKGLLI